MFANQIITMQIEISQIMKALADKQEAFASVSEFRDAFLNTATDRIPDLELSHGRQSATDVPHGVVLCSTDEEVVALSLHYRTKRFSGSIGSRMLDLKEHGARDHGRYDFLRDVDRMEKFLLNNPAIARGFVILLTNDPGYWNGPSRPTIDAEFNIAEQISTSGILRWSDGAGEGSTRNRQDPIRLDDTYRMVWRDYLTLDDTNGEFRYLALQVTKPKSDAEDIQLDDNVIDEWLSALREEYPGFKSFDQPHAAFEEAEIEFKAGYTNALREGFENAAKAEDLPSALYEAFKNYSLINWRVSSILLQDWPKTEVGAALKEIETASADDLPDAVSRFQKAWMADVPNAKQDHARQLAGAVAMHFHPEDAIYFRKTVRNQFYQQAVHRQFPKSDDPADEFRHELAFGRAVEQKFRQRGLSPRNLIDVQSALWRIHKRISETRNSPTDDDAEERPVVPVSLNTVLYGPPGTGKTYETAKRAVEICDGSAPADREAVMTRYSELVNANRIAFVTFHQSYGYEEFVEGLRPDTGTEDEDSSTGLRLVPVPGVLRRLAERARTYRGVPDDAFRMTGRKVFKMSLGRNTPADEELREECLQSDRLLLGNPWDIDWSDPVYRDFKTIYDRIKEVDASATGRQATVIEAFHIRANMAVGDIVVASKGLRAFHAVGIVTGEYEYLDDREDAYTNSRRVDWVWQSDDGLPVTDIYAHPFNRNTLYRMRDDKIDWDYLASLVSPQTSAPPPPHVLIIDEINRANVSKVMGEMITLLEEDKRAGAQNEIAITLPHSGKLFTLPPNLHILGTMNTADRSIALLDSALRRRFRFEHLEPQPEVLMGSVAEIPLSGVLRTINQRIEYMLGPDHLIGHGWFMDAPDRMAVDATMAYKVIPLLREYFHDDLERVRAILGGGDGFLRRIRLTPPPGLEDDGFDERYRYEDAYGPDGYSDSAWQELIAGVATSSTGGEDEFDPLQAAD